jgi:FixJ family two-component response regulator
LARSRKPCCDAARISATTSAGEEQILRRAFPVVAVIDDNDMIRDGLASLLSSAAYLTECYASAEEFLAKVAVSEAACLVVDIEMTGLSGIELGRRLAALGYAFPIIFLTASTDPCHRRDAMALGCMGFLEKPNGTHQLLDLIALAVRR